MNATAGQVAQNIAGDARAKGNGMHDLRQRGHLDGTPFVWCAEKPTQKPAKRKKQKRKNEGLI